MVRYLERYCEEEAQENSQKEPSDLTVLDLGMGNGHLLFALLEADIEPSLTPSNLLGVDYSSASVALAKSIAKRRDEETDGEYRFAEVRFEESDLLDSAEVDKLRGPGSGWDIVCDKGTFDAIALSSQPINGKLPVDLYTEAVARLTSPGGIFLITSCNFTEKELVGRFAGSDSAAFKVQKIVPTPQFSFVSVIRSFRSM